MKTTVNILGYYKRKRDGSEFVLYEENGRIRLTNGIFVWRDRIKERYLPQCEKADDIDVKKIIGYLEKYQCYSGILDKLKEGLN